MKQCAALIAILLLPLFVRAADPATAPATKPIKVLVISGGTENHHTAFYDLFKNASDMAITEVAEGKVDGDASVYDRAELLNFDLVFLYDLQEKISPAGRAKFLSLFDHGIGLIVLHDALLSYQDWPEYERISGGTYLLDNRKYGDTLVPASTVGRKVDIAISVTDKQSPVAAGVGDFKIHDEIYRGVPTGADIHVVFSAEGKPLIWTRTEKQARVFTCIIGHGPGTWGNASFQKVLTNAVHWAARQG